MLASLSIRDIVLIEKLNLDWQSALCTLTGETGAGKSILLDALGLATGARGDVGLVRQGSAQGSVAAVFNLTPSHPVQALLHESGLLNGAAHVPELILRRVQTADGRTRAFCNDRPVSVGLLAEIGKMLVEIHGQNEGQSLTDAATQRHLLDNFAGLTGDVARLGGLYEKRKELAERLAAQRAAMAKTAEETEFLTHALEELRVLEPQLGEEQRLADERSLLMNAEKIAADLNEATQSLQGDGGIESALSGALRRLERVADEAGGHLDEAIQALDRAVIEAGEARTAVAQAAASLTHDPARQEFVEQRLFTMRDLARKHNVEPDALVGLGDTLAQRLDDIAGGSERLDALERELSEAECAYGETAEAVSAARQDAAQKLDAKVNTELPPLKLDGGCFTTQVETVTLAEGGAHGIDRVRFDAATNPGMAPGPIAKIASGGELARFMLALKVALAGSESASTLIFDEVDAGVGGAVAEAVGARLHRLAQQGQVLVVTHSPQVAARGDHQWKVSKSDSGQGVVTDVVALDAPARLEEVARMLAGAEVTDEARAAARRLLDGHI